MFDSQTSENGVRPLKTVAISHLARDSLWSLDVDRTYLVPVLFWFTSGQGRIRLGGSVRGFTAHNAIFLPANTPHACDILCRTQGTALFFGGRRDLPAPAGALHLRLTGLQQQSDLNQLVEGFRRDSETAGPLMDEVVHHRAALTLLWLSQQALALGNATLDTSPIAAPQALRPAAARG